MDFDWSAIIAMILEMLNQCLEERGRDVTEKRLNKPGLVEAWSLRAMLRKQGCRGPYLREQVKEAMAYLANMHPEEIAALLDEAESDVMVPK